MEVKNILANKIMPHDLQAEQSVLGSLLIDNALIEPATELLTGDDFYAKQNGLVFDAIKTLYKDGKSVDTVTLCDQLRTMDAPEEMTSPDYIRDILNAVPTSTNMQNHAQIVSEKSTVRKLIRVAEQIADDCYQGYDGLPVILEMAEKSIFDLVRSRSKSDYVPISDIVIDVLKQIEEASKSKGHVTGLPTGFCDLDRMLAGLQRSDFILVAGRPSMGKTAFALSLLIYSAIKKNQPAVIFSMEMSKEQIVQRLQAMLARVDAQKIRTGNLTDEEWAKVVEASETIGNSKLIIDDARGLTVGEIRSRCRRYKMDSDIQLVFIDYIQLMSASARKSENRQQEISDISRELKDLAGELNVPVVVLSQLNRAVESRPNHRPILADIRESGAIEQDADVIMFLYRDDYYNPETDDKDTSEVIIAKQRKGPIGTVKLVWQPQYTRFVNLLRPEDRSAM